MVGSGSVLDNVFYTRCREIRLPSAPAGIVNAGASWLVVDDVIANCAANLSEVGAREVVVFLRPVITAWRDLRCKYRLAYLL